MQGFYAGACCLLSFFAWCDPPIYHCWRERKLKNDNAAEKKKNKNDSLFVFFLGHISRGDVSAKFRCLS
jgi:hypothetical protein